MATEKLVAAHPYAATATDSTSVDEARDRPPPRRRCAHLFPGLTGCRNQADPGSRYCAEHGEAP